MVDRNFRVQFDEADWDALKLGSALACRGARPRTADESPRWSSLAELLRQVGLQAAGRNGEGDLALCVLADFADEAACHDAVARARALAAECSESALQAVIENAAAVVDRACPDQSFRFRATLVVLSLLAEAHNCH